MFPQRRFRSAECLKMGFVFVAALCVLRGQSTQQPLSFQDYVIVHELLHLRIRNHGKLFKTLLAAYLPDWTASATDSRARRGAQPMPNCDLRSLAVK